MSARMIPSMGPAPHHLESLEGDIYDALKKLPNDFTVIHSFRTLDITEDDRIEQREADFVIFNRTLGILVIEAKAGNVCCVNGEWKYANNTLMSYGGPFRQAEDMMWQIYGRFSKAGIEELREKCWLSHAAWLASLYPDQLGFIDDISDAHRAITLCKTEIADNPTEMIEKIMRRGNHKGPLTEDEAKEVLHKVLLPEFDIVPTSKIDYKYNDFIFTRLLESQARVLHFLQDQRMAVINGAAGTGKTLIAVERAKQAAQTGKVLFLCYNKLLNEDIKERLQDCKNIDVYTIDGYTWKKCRGKKANYRTLVSILESNPSAFQYKHVIIDEGQDFGQKEIEEAGVLDTLRRLIDERPDGTLYLFYDKNQLVQGSSMPKFLLDADCKLTLYVNCRNTELIARSPLNALTTSAPTKVSCFSSKGERPRMFINDNPEEAAKFVDQQIDELRDAGLDNIVVITCKTYDSSSQANSFSGAGDTRSWKDKGVPVYTVRKFKGLEADAVILIDVDQSLWKVSNNPYDPSPGLLFYTAASRAKHELRIIGDMNAENCSEALASMNEEPAKQPEEKLAEVLGATLAKQ